MLYWLFKTRLIILNIIQKIKSLSLLKKNQVLTLVISSWPESTKHLKKVKSVSRGK